MFIIYNDGRPGHKASAEILTSDERGMVVQFADRADTSKISFTDEAWMKHIMFIHRNFVAERMAE